MKSEHTRIVLGETLVKLMKIKPLDKISVAEVISVCNLSRRTFYYHFKDKQDLVCWIFDKVILEQANLDEFPIDALRNYMYHNRGFYINVIQSAIGSKFRKHIFDFIYGYCYKQILKILGDRAMDTKRIRFFTNYFTHAIIGCTLDWVEDGGMPCPKKDIDGGYREVTIRCMHFTMDEYATD